MANPATVAHGPGLIGTFLNILLYGIMVSQTYLYFTKFKTDKLWMKLFVLLLFIADTLNSVFDMWWIYSILINDFGDLEALRTANWVFATDPAMVGIIATLVQLFFAWRVKVLTGRMWVVMIIVVTAMGSVCGGIGTAIAIHFVPEFIHFQKFQVVVIVWLILAAICDMVITIALTLHLRTHRTGFTQTDDILDKIVRLTVQNGLLTAVWAVVDLAAYLASTTGLHLAFNFPLAKLYTNSLMSSLNSRSGWSYSGRSESTGRDVQGNRDAASRKPDVVTFGTTTRPEVFVQVESHELVDVVGKRDIEWSSASDTDERKLRPQGVAV